MNPVFSKQFQDENQTELVMDEIKSVEGTKSNEIDSNTSTIFSSNIDKDKLKKKKTNQKKKGKFLNLEIF